MGLDFTGSGDSEEGMGQAYGHQASVGPVLLGRLQGEWRDLVLARTQYQRVQSRRGPGRMPIWRAWDWWGWREAGLMMEARR